MELQLIIFSVFLPTACAVALVVLSRRIASPRCGAALALALVLSAMSQDSFGGIPPTNGWMWFPLAVAALACAGAVAGRSVNTRGRRAVFCLIAAMIAALLLPIPMWGAIDSRLLLALTLATVSALLLPIGMHRGGFSTWFAFSIALAGTSGIALLTCFAKLAITLGAASFTCGMLGLAATVFHPRHTLHAGFTGTLVIAGCSVLGAATSFAYETNTTPHWIFFVAAIAPLGCWLGEAQPFRSSVMASALARIIGTLALAGLAVVGATLSTTIVSSASKDAYACISGNSGHNQIASRVQVR